MTNPTIEALQDAVKSGEREARPMLADALEEAGDESGAAIQRGILFSEQMEIFLRKISKLVREHCGQSGTPYPILVIHGPWAPKLVGHAAYHTNKRGDIIRHVSAYGAKGRSSLVYHPSTRAIEVGERWLSRRGLIAPKEIV